MTDGIKAYHGNHFIVYKNIGSLWCVPETNRILYVMYASIKLITWLIKGMHPGDISLVKNLSTKHISVFMAWFHRMHRSSSTFLFIWEEFIYNSNSAWPCRLSTQRKTSGDILSVVGRRSSEGRQRLWREHKVSPMARASMREFTNPSSGALAKLHLALFHAKMSITSSEWLLSSYCSGVCNCTKMVTIPPTLLWVWVWHCLKLWLPPSAHLCLQFSQLWTKNYSRSIFCNSPYFLLCPTFLIILHVLHLGLLYALLNRLRQVTAETNTHLKAKKTGHSASS